MIKKEGLSRTSTNALDATVTTLNTLLSKSLNSVVHFILIVLDTSD